MTEPLPSTGQSLKYYLLSTLSFGIHLLGYLGLKIVILSIAVFVSLVVKNKVGNISMKVGWFLGIVGGSVFLFLFQKIYPKIEKLDEYLLRLKRRPFTEKFGKDFPVPKSEDFGITSQEFNEYNRRFQFDLLRVVFSYGLCGLTSIYIIYTKVSAQRGLLLLGLSLFTAITINYFFKYLNNQISIKHRYYNKIHKFQVARRIYNQIQKENSR